MSNKMYDILKWVVCVVLPALATLYVALADLWGFGYVEQVSGTIAAITTFLGAVLMISSAKYNAENNEEEEE